MLFARGASAGETDLRLAAFPTDFALVGLNGLSAAFFPTRGISMLALALLNVGFGLKADITQWSIAGPGERAEGRAGGDNLSSQ
jgi:hypothetical protein